MCTASSASCLGIDDSLNSRAEVRSALSQQFDALIISTLVPPSRALFWETGYTMSRYMMHIADGLDR
ncbi:hypothetical protein BN1708_004153 [Verticillium longisporum]|uniref:Uncharacterized protein n=1 Tax=Verticillium longisporum TaxID=100787 RepID=A0A0G4LWU4_VERLO|nr:hypothetical protein BN1708_004153 [Verticillium longisporum]